MKKYLPVIVVIILSTLSVRYFFYSNYIPTHDAEYHIVRLWQFDKVMKSGILFPRWAPDLNNGYGVPLFQFFYPLPNYIGELFHIIGFSFITSIKLTLASGLIISSIGFYLWSRYFFKTFTSIVTTVLYVLAPYHTVDVSIRGSVGEVWALAVVPFCLYLTTKIILGPKNYTIFTLNIVFLFLLLLSHTILGVVFFLFTLLYAFILHYSQKEKKRNKKIYLSFLFALLLTSFFWIPILFESKYVKGLDIVDYKDHFVEVFQLLFPSWGSGFSVPGLNDQISFQVGIPHLIGLCISLYFVIKDKKYVFLSLFVLLSVSIFLMVESSIFVWKLIPLLKFFQFPWRLLSLVILISSFLIGIAIEKKRVIGFMLLLLIWFMYVPYTTPVTYAARSDNFFLSNPDWIKGTATLGNTFNTIWYSETTRTPSQFEILSGAGSIHEQKADTLRYTAIVEAATPLTLQLHTAYFPGWTATIDKQNTPVTPAQNGMVQLKIPEGKHSIMVQFGSSFPRIVGNSLSLVSLLTIMFCNYKKVI